MHAVHADTPIEREYSTVLLCSPRATAGTAEHNTTTQNTISSSSRAAAQAQHQPTNPTRLDNNHAKCQLNLTDERRRLAAPRLVVASS